MVGVSRALRFISAVILLPAAAAAQGLSADESRMAGYIDANAGEAIALLERIVNINSGTLNPEGVKRVHEALAPELEALGFEVRYAELPMEMGRGGHLVATRRPASGVPNGRKVLLIGHLDTVFEEDSPFQTFERLNDSIARGPGAADMKGGDVVIVQALQALASVGALDGAHITVVMTGDEEAPGRPLEVARQALIEAGIEADVALGFEGGSRERDGTTRAVVARRSSSSWRLDVAARPAHSSGVFSSGVGAGAIYEAARILDRFYAEIRGEQNLTFNVGLILGGTEVDYDAAQARGSAFGKTNVVPETAVATGDIRTLTDEQLERTRERMPAIACQVRSLPAEQLERTRERMPARWSARRGRRSEQLERTRERMRHIVASGLPMASARIAFSDGYPSMPPTDANYALLETYSDASQALGAGPVLAFDPAQRGAADVSFVASHIDAGMDGLGPFGSGSHTVEETVNLNSLALQAKRAAVLIYRLTR